MKIVLDKLNNSMLFKIFKESSDEKLVNKAAGILIKRKSATISMLKEVAICSKESNNAHTAIIFIVLRHASDEKALCKIGIKRQDEVGETALTSLFQRPFVSSESLFSVISNCKNNKILNLAEKNFLRSDDHSEDVLKFFVENGRTDEIKRKAKAGLESEGWKYVRLLTKG